MIYEPHTGMVHHTPSVLYRVTLIVARYITPPGMCEFPRIADFVHDMACLRRQHTTKKVGRERSRRDTAVHRPISRHLHSLRCHENQILYVGNSSEGVGCVIMRVVRAYRTTTHAVVEGSNGHLSKFPLSQAALSEASLLFQGSSAES